MMGATSSEKNLNPSFMIAGVIKQEHIPYMHVHVHVDYGKSPTIQAHAHTHTHTHTHTKVHNGETDHGPLDPTVLSQCLSPPWQHEG